MKPIAFLESEKGPEDWMGVALRRIVSMEDWYDEQQARAISETHLAQIKAARETATEEYYTPMVDWWPSMNAFASLDARSFHGRSGHDYEHYEIFPSRELAVMAWRARQEDQK